MDIILFLAIITIIFPYIVYAMAYKYPNITKKYLAQKQIIQIGQWFKVFEAIFMFPTLYNAGFNGSGMIFDLPLVFLGQYLNELVYAIIGEAGVYYGYELKTIKPRIIRGFPFNVIDPQYKGAILTVIGGSLCFNTTKNLMIIDITWMACYFSGLVNEHSQTIY